MRCFNYRYFPNPIKIVFMYGYGLFHLTNEHYSNSLSYFTCNGFCRWWSLTNIFLCKKTLFSLAIIQAFLCNVPFREIWNIMKYNVTELQSTGLWLHDYLGNWSERGLHTHTQTHSHTNTHTHRQRHTYTHTHTRMERGYGSVWGLHSFKSFKCFIVF